MSDKEIDIFKETEGTNHVVKQADVSLGSYIEEYDGFINSFRHMEVSGSEIGEMIAKMSQHYTRHNLAMIRSLKVFNNVKREIFNGTDDQGKPLSAVKADTIADATPEAYGYQESRAHVQNIEQHINALKALQRGVLNEYTHQ